MGGEKAFPSQWDTFHTFRSKTPRQVWEKAGVSAQEVELVNGGIIHAVLVVGPSRHLKAACSRGWEQPGLGLQCFQAQLLLAGVQVLLLMGRSAAEIVTAVVSGGFGATQECCLN